MKACPTRFTSGMPPARSIVSGTARLARTAVGVAVVRDPQIRRLLLHLRDDELAVLGEQWIRLVVREAPVRLEVAAHDVELR